MTFHKRAFDFFDIITSVRTHLGDLSSGGRFHERAAQHLQGVGPNVMVCLFFEAAQDSTDYLASYALNSVSIII
jgi:hypothetical protein